MSKSKSAHKPIAPSPVVPPGSKVKLNGSVALVVRLDPLGNLRLKMRDRGEFWCSPDLVEVLVRP